jgi:hypothetical protein
MTTCFATPVVRRFLTTSVVSLTAIFAFSNSSAIAQVAPAIAQAAPSLLHIDILEGEGALNNIRQRDAREPVVQITDENHKPVSGVAVLFLIHGGGNGATASFGGQASSLTVKTGADGIARAPGLQLANTPGSFTIAVSATLGTLVATTVIHQSAVLTALPSTAASTAESAATTTGKVAAHHVLGLSATQFVAVAVVAAVAAVTVVDATKSSGTSLALGSATIGP